jgi:hypothetical protein
MSYKDLFQQRGNSRAADIRITCYLHAPEELDTADRIAFYDKDAARMIENCKALIDNLTEYRQALTARYGALATMASKDSIKLERYRSYGGGITYYIRHFTEYEDGTKVETATETFPSKERHAAIKRFEELKKARPGIEYITDIEKKSWEK